MDNIEILKLIFGLGIWLGIFAVINKIFRDKFLAGIIVLITVIGVIIYKTFFM